MRGLLFTVIIDTPGRFVKRGPVFVSGSSSLQRRFDLLDHGGVFLVAQEGLAGVHGEDAAPLKAVPVLGHEVHVQVAARVAVGAVVELLGVEGRVDGLGGAVHVGKERVALRLRDVGDLAHMVLVGHDAAAGMALLLEEDELAHAQIADLDAEGAQPPTPPCGAGAPAPRC